MMATPTLTSLIVWRWVMKLTLVSIVVSAVASPAFAGGANVIFALPAVSTFDGSQWGQLTLGQTSASDLKADYKINKRGNSVPWALRLSDPKGSGYSLTALMGGKNDSSFVSAFWLRYDKGMTLSDFTSANGTDGTCAYAPTRFTDWYLYTYPSKGIVAFVDGNTGVDIVWAVFLTNPDVEQHMFSKLPTTATKISPPFDPHAGESKVVQIGTETVNRNLTGLTMSDDEANTVLSDMQSTTCNGTVQFVANTSGTFTTDISGSYDPDKGGSLSVSCEIDGTTPYGPVSATSSRTVTYEKNADVTHSVGYEESLLLALNAVESSFADAVNAAGPPAPDSFRLMNWDVTFNRLRIASMKQVLGTGVVDYPLSNPWGSPIMSNPRLVTGLMNSSK